MLKDFERLVQDHTARGSFGAHVLSSERSAPLVEVIQLGCICYIFRLIKQRL